MTKIDAFLAGMVVSMIFFASLIEGSIRPSAKESGYNRAKVEITSQLNDLHHFGLGFDQTYDLGYEKCQELTKKMINERKYEQK